MGRKRIHFSKVVDKTLRCETCGKEWRCCGEAVKVQCDLCMLGAKIVDENSLPLPEFVPEPRVKRPRGRPRKNPIVLPAPVAQEKVIAVTAPEEAKPKRGRGRPRKNPLPNEKKGNKMDAVEKKVEAKDAGGKRGRKATVGSAVLGFIKGQKGEVKFTDILNVYSSEREKLGKKSTPEIEARNCYSTLYVLCRDGRLAEVSKKTTYRAV